MTSETFHTLCIVFLILAILLTVLTVIFFFVFDIRKIISIKSGSAMRKGLKQLEKNYRDSSAEQKQSAAKKVYTDRSSSDEEVTTPLWQTEDGEQTTPLWNEEEEGQTTPLWQTEDEEQTVVLRRPENEETTVLNRTVTQRHARKGDTTVLSMIDQKETKPTGRFEITETKTIKCKTEDKI